MGVAAIAGFILLSPKNESTRRGAPTSSVPATERQPSGPATLSPSAPTGASEPDITLDLSVNGNDPRAILNVTTTFPRGAL